MPESRVRQRRRLTASPARRGRPAGPVSALVALALLAAAFVAMAGTACSGSRSGTPLEQTESARAVGAQPPSPAASATTGDSGTAAPPVRTPSDKATCPLDREVANPAQGTPEAVLLALYQAASAPDSEASFSDFARHFGAEHQRSWVKSQYWPRIRQHVSKYVTNREPFTIRVCREDRKTDTVKFFVRSLEPSKSHPPVTLRNEGDAWVVEFFTP